MTIKAHLLDTLDCVRHYGGIMLDNLFETICWTGFILSAIFAF